MLIRHNLESVRNRCALISAFRPSKFDSSAVHMSRSAKLAVEFKSPDPLDFLPGIRAQPYLHPSSQPGVLKMRKYGESGRVYTAGMVNTRYGKYPVYTAGIYRYLRSTPTPLRSPGSASSHRAPCRTQCGTHTEAPFVAGFPPSIFTFGLV